MSDIRRIGFNPTRMMDPMLAGSFIPTNKIDGSFMQFYMRSTGDIWMNINGQKLWLKIYEV